MSTTATIKLVNLTPHAVRIYDWDGNFITELPVTREDDYYRLTFVSAAAATVRVDDHISGLGPIAVDGGTIPVANLQAGGITGYPEPQPGMAYVVSRVAAEAITRICDGNPRYDILMPGPEIRDETGRIVGCKGLSTMAHRTPAEICQHCESESGQ